jgi:hypothetical protein
MTDAFAAYIQRRRRPTRPSGKCVSEVYRSAEASVLEGMAQTDFDPEYVFSHHPATPEKHAHYDAIHEGAKRFAEVLIAHVPACSDRAAALRLLRESSMVACAAVALDGRLK